METEERFKPYRESLIKEYNTTPADILIEYNPPERILVVNEDPNLFKIDISDVIPIPPPEHKIDGFGFPIKEQKFVVDEMPPRLTTLIKRHQTSEQVWASLEESQQSYSHEILWIKMQWKRILEGYWFYCNGTPLYISGIHYAYISFWKIDVGLPSYRYRDRKFFLFGKYCETTTEAFDPDYVNKHGRPIPDAKGKYRMRDTGRRVCAGFLYPKHRREGASYKAACYNYFSIVYVKNARNGIQAMDKETANDVFSVKLKEPWKKLPFFLRPIYSGSTDAASSLSFKPQAKVISSKLGSLLSGGEGLQSFIDFAQTAKRGFYDGGKLKFIHVDECGKCFGIDTPIKLHKGGNKAVQYIEIGDEIMGPDYKKRTVTSLGRGKEMMYRIIPNKGDPWVCNESHILSVKAVTKKAIDWYGVNKDEVVNITIKEYLSLHKIAQKHLCLYKVHANRQVDILRFKVERIGVDDYYGFTLKENPLFLLGDCTVAHNTILENIDERNQVLMRCLEVGSNIIGMSIHTSTVAEQKKQGGANFKALSDKSQWEERDLNGQTMSKIFVLFISAADGLEGYIDEYGYSVISKPTKEQAEYIGDTIGALEYLENTNNKLLSEGKIDQYNENLRQKPIKYKHCFIGDQSESGFNLMKINKRMDELDDMNDATVRGNFVWVTPRDSDAPYVQWVPNQYGRWYVSYIPEPSKRNQMYRKDGMWYPSNPNSFITGADPYRFTKVVSSRKSLGGGATFWIRDLKIDPPSREVEQWQSHRFVCTYLNRVDSKKDYADDMLKQTVFYGGLCYPENNIPVINDEFEHLGYGGYLKYDVDEKGKESVNAGYYLGNTDKIKQSIFSEFMNYIQVHSPRERHIEILNECKNIGGIEEMTNFDLFSAAGGCFHGIKDAYGDTPIVRAEEDSKIDINRYFRTYNY